MDKSDTSAAAYFGLNRNDIGGTMHIKGKRDSLLTPGAGGAEIGKSFGSMHIKTPSAMDMPKLNLDVDGVEPPKNQPTTTKNLGPKEPEKKEDDKDKAKEAKAKGRQLSDSSRGSIGRK
jgi:hypothetical protein